MLNNDNQIIFPGYVKDIRDPKMLGRIRAIPLSEDRQGIVKAFDPSGFKDVNSKLWWTKDDPFLTYPLLPFYISMPIKDEEYVNLIYSDKSKKFKNQYYIPGLKTSPMLNYFEDYSSTMSLVLGGDTNKLFTDIKLKTGDYIDKQQSFGVFPEPVDTGYMGSGNADIIIKNNEVLMRAGKYSAEQLNPTKLPTANPMRSYVHVTNFNQKLIRLPDETILTSKNEVKTLKWLVEWGIINPENQFDAFTGYIQLVRVTPNEATNTEEFCIDSDIINFITAPIVRVNFQALSAVNVANLIKKFLLQVDDGLINMPDIELYTLPSDHYPWAFRPNPMTYRFSRDIFNYPNEGENVNKIMDRVIFDEKTGAVIVYKKGNTEKDQKPIIEDVPQAIYTRDNFSLCTIGGDEIYILSNESQIGQNQKIDLEGTLYGFDQPRIQQIRERTCSTVRGEPLLELIDTIVNFLITHTHAIPGAPPASQSENGATVDSITKKNGEAPFTILNQKIRIN